jgi:hypothetical protein
MLAEEWPELVGTIAGYNGILMTTPDSQTGEAIQEKLVESGGKGLGGAEAHVRGRPLVGLFAMPVA